MKANFIVRAEQKLADIEGKLEELNRMKNALELITEACCGGEESAVYCSILNALDENSPLESPGIDASHVVTVVC